MNNITQFSSVLLISHQEKLEIRQLVRIEAQKLSTRRLASLIGMLNHYCWRVAKNYDAIATVVFYDEDGNKKTKPQVKINEFQRLLISSLAGEIKIEVSQDALSNYLHTHWGELKAYHGVPLLGKLRKFFADVLGIFTFDQNRPKGGKWGAAHGKPGEGVATPPIFEQVDFVRMLIIYQEFYKIIRSRIDEACNHGRDGIESFDFMPSHGGALMIDFFNTAFFPVEEFHRGNVEQISSHTDIVFTPTEEVFEEKESLPELVRWKWKKFKKMSKQIWISLVTKGGQVVEDLFIPLGEPTVICPPLEKMMKFVPY